MLPFKGPYVLWENQPLKTLMPLNTDASKPVPKTHHKTDSRPFARVCVCVCVGISINYIFCILMLWYPGLCRPEEGLPLPGLANS